MVSLGIAQSSHQLLLRNGTLNIAENAATFAENFQPSKAQVFQGHYALLIQFQSIPDPVAHAMIDRLGVKLLDYLPNYAYLAAVPENLSLAQLNALGVRAYMQPGRELRLSKDLFQQNYPSWAMRGEEVALNVLPYRHIATADILPALRTRCTVVQEGHAARTVQVRIHPSKIDQLLELPFVQYVEAVAPASTPDDVRGRSLHRSNAINTQYGAGRHYDGTGVTIGLADDGIIGPHIDYTGRLTNYATSNNGTHGDMTAGIFFGAGNRNPDIVGHASGAYMHYWDIGTYEHIVDAVAHYNTLDLTITSTSYSQGQGGVYTTDTEFIDDQIYDQPWLEHVFSGGNAGTSDHGYGAGAGWGNITGGYKAGKSVITCGNLNDVDVLEGSSSRGPADDGRIKPDICANGAGQLSTDGPNGDQVGGGTSAASPSIAGCVAQLYHAYKSLNGGVLPASGLIKASILNTGEDLGNPGPDYKHGWGRINSLRAVRVLEENRYLTASVAQGATNTHSLTIPAGTTELRVMVYWTDYAGTPAAVKALVNDLNITVTNGTVYQPWVLNPAPNATTLNANAVRGTDNLNNMEQVTISNPTAGVATVTVNGATVPFGPQNYWLVYEYVQPKIELTYPIGGEGIAPTDVQKIRWDAFGASGSFTLEYSTNNGTNWTLISNSVSSGARTFDWTVPALTTGQARVRVTAGALSDQSDAPFTIARVPSNLQVLYVCPDSIGLSWNAATGATGYEVSRLGARYMDSIHVSTGTTATLTGLNPNLNHWFSVSSLTANNGQGRRAIAIEHPGGTLNCIIPNDVEMTSVLSPGGGILPECQTSPTTAVIVRVTNTGTSAASNIPVHYSINNGPAVSEVLAGPVAAGASQNYTFTATANLSVAGTYNLVAWTSMVGDGNIYNDSSSTSSIVIPATPLNLPITQNFETFSLCGTANDCEAENCAMSSGWLNFSNQGQDDIDWRTSEGPTASVGTGPDIDHNPGTATGNYLFLEASGPCPGKTAILLSPCVNLVGATSPQATFWYHMNGANMGEMHVDVLSEGVLFLDAISPIVGNQGNTWRSASINLTPYVGKVVNIRFRGITGSDFASDLAIDDIFITESASAPVINFTASNTAPCIGSAVTLADQSLNNPTSWAWAIQPNTFTYVGGTNANSQNPQVQFSAAGNYNVALTATNTFGSNTVTQTAYIAVPTATTPNITEDFAAFTPAGWSIVSAGGGYTWEISPNITGANGQTTTAAYVNNYAYNNPNAEDRLLTMSIDLLNATAASMTFDVAYVEYATTLIEGLRVDVSLDCGVTYVPTAYDKVGAVLATAPLNTATWAPAAAADWRNETVDLTPWVGNLVKIAFVNTNDYGNNLYVDNVNIISSPNAVDPGLNAAWRVFPNPSNGRFTLEVDVLPSGTSSLSIFDLAGRLGFQQTLQGNGGFHRSQFDLSALPAGIYTLELQSEGLRQVRKLVIQ
jgi:PKD repeat protein